MAIKKLLFFSFFILLFTLMLTSWSSQAVFAVTGGPPGVNVTVSPLPSTLTPTLTIPVSTPVKGRSIPVPGIGNEAVPYLNCGVAGSSDANRCCYSKKKHIPGLNLLRGIPFVGKWIGRATSITDSINEIQSPCVYGTPSMPGDPSSSQCKCEITTLSPKPLKAATELCKQYIKPRFSSSSYEHDKLKKELDSCLDCANKGGYLSAIGCIPLQTNSLLASFLLKIGISFAGILALLCIIYGAITLQISQGNPEKVKKAREMMTACILGLLVIIFSIFILRVVGVNILKIPFMY